MKEFTLREKAKAYDEALERARNLHKDAIDMGENIRAKQCEIIFPELKESEDEKIRKNLITFFKDEYGTNSSACFAGIKVKDIIVWLEKQGKESSWKPTKEQYETLNYEFKAKDWYVSKVDGKIYNAKFMEKPSTNLSRKLEIENAAFSATGIIDQEEWFINGAEWADKNLSYISSEKQDEKKNIIIPKFRVGDEIKTANEESLTITKIDEKGYWSGDLFICDFDEECMWNLVNEKIPVEWSEKDDEIREALIKGFNECVVSSSHYPKNAIKYWHGIVIEDIFAWLKSIKQRIGG